MNLESNNPLYDQFIQGLNSNYVFVNLQSGMNYDVTPAKGGDFGNGISTFDILKVTRHVLGNELFTSPYQLFAADVNGDKKVSTSDVLSLRRLILALKSDFDGKQTSWNFVPSDYQFLDPTNPLAENFGTSIAFDALNNEIFAANFIGIKMGDINDSATSDLLNVGPSSTSAFLLTDDQQFDKDAIVELTLNADQLGEFAGQQLFLGVDNDALEVIEIQGEGSVIMDASNYVINKDGIRVC